jgi:hypothetical protein
VREGIVELGKGAENELASMRYYKSHEVNFRALLTPDGAQPLESVCLKKDDVLSVPSLQWRRRLQCREGGVGCWSSFWVCSRY